MRNVPFEATTTLSRKILRYASGKGHSDGRIAEMLGVPEGFVRLVNRRERSLTPDHIELLAGGLREPIGAMLAAATRPTRELTDEQKAFYKMSDEFLLQGDCMREAILRSSPKPSPRAVSSRVGKASAKSAVKTKKLTKSRSRKAA